MKAKIYSLSYWLNNVNTGVILSGNKALCNWKKRELLKAGTHKNGQFKISQIK